MTTLAIDPGRETGAAWEINGNIKYKTLQLGAKPASRLTNLIAFIEEINKDHKINKIAYETAWSGSKPAIFRALCHYEAMLLYWADSHSIQCDGYSPREIKSSIKVGPGNKDGVMRGVRLCGFNPQTTHESDALALLLLVMRKIPPRNTEKKAAAVATKKLADLFSKQRKYRL